VFVFVPCRADAEKRPSARHDVEGRHGLREEGRVPIRDAAHQRAEADPAGALAQGTERRIGFEHWVRFRPDADDLIEVVHHGHEAEARPFRGAGERRDVVEQPIWRHARERVVGHVIAEPDRHQVLQRRGRSAPILRRVAERRRAQTDGRVSSIIV